MTVSEAKLLMRFESQYMPEPNSGCWLWMGARWASRNGRHGRYGCIRINGKTHAAHRVAHRLFKGEIPEGLSVLHRCDNPACVNPDHLFVGTAADNMRDMHRKNRHRRNDPVGEKSHASKLCEEEVRQVKFGSLSSFHPTKVAKILHVSRSAIDLIKSGKTWGHIHE